MKQTIPLKTLLEQITKSPWPDDGFEMTPHINATHAELDRDDWIMARHCVNTLPKLVEACKPMAQPVTTPEEYQAFKEALAAAEQVEL